MATKNLVVRKETNNMPLSILKHLMDAIVQGLGFPIGAVLTDMSGKILSTKANAKGTGNKTTHKTHAEFIALSGLPKGHTKKLRLYVTYPPCSHCLKEFMDKGISLEVIYLFDPWGKRYKDYLKPISLKHFETNSPLITIMWKKIEQRYLSKKHNLARRHLKKRQHSKVILRMAPKH